MRWGAYGVRLVLAVAMLVAGIELLGRRAVSVPTASSPSSPGYPRQIVDSSGTVLTQVSSPQRIVSQTLATDEILLAICPHERIVALSALADDASYSNVAERGLDVRARCMQGGEQIVQMRPDLVFVASYSRAELVSQRRASQAPVYRLASFDSLHDIESTIRAVGQAVGCDAAAAGLIESMHRDLTTIQQRLPKGRRPLRVLSYSPGGYTAGAGTLFDDEVRAVGAIDVGAEQGLHGFVHVSAEQLARWKPDVIVDGAPQSQLASHRASLMAEPVISRLGARVLVLENRHLMAASHYCTQGVRDLAEGLYETP
jgi:iron complex transport system substrate-binding protein